MITGASTGIGKATATLFAQKGWNVIATMRTLTEDKEFASYPNIRCLALDVTDKESIAQAINEGISLFGRIDVLHNNAGYALAGAFEAIDDHEVRKQFETNVFGIMNVTRAVLPHFRGNRNGMIINTTSSGGIFTFPLYSIYNCTKWAVEGFMESLQFELKQFNIRVKNIEPGSVQSAFVANIKYVSNSDYQEYASRAQEKTLAGYKKAAMPQEVAGVIFKAVTDGSKKLRYPATRQAKGAFFLRWLLPLNTFNKIMSSGLD